MRNGLFWKGVFEQSFVPEIETYASALEGRLLKTFDSVESEADQLQQEILDSYSNSYAADEEDEGDPASEWEHAQEEAVDHVLTMGKLKQGLTNLWGAGLFHLFEQQMRSFLAHELLPHGRDVRRKPGVVEQAKPLLANQQPPINIELFASWAKVKELRWLANCVKHAEADGGDCEKLRRVRQDLFANPAVPSCGEVVTEEADSPLTGMGLYLTPASFAEFAVALKRFWEELGKAIAEGETYQR
jgi:hypothetical protein